MTMVSTMVSTLAQELPKLIEQLASPYSAHPGRRSVARAGEQKLLDLSASG